MKERDLREYQTEAGRNPFREWLHGLRDEGVRARIRVRLNRVRLGNFGDSKQVGGGVHELRFSFGPGYRVYFGLDGDILVILLNGGEKRLQMNDIATAKAYWGLYCQRRKT